jgi:hypothetical protein
MLRLKVCGIDEAVPAVFSFRPGRVISILDKDVDERHPEKFTKIKSIAKFVGESEHRIWHFEDDDSDTHPDAPKLHITRSILEWAVGPRTGWNREVTADRILVHCHGGIARSSTIAFGIMLLDGFDPKEGLQVLFASRVDQFTGLTAMWPNTCMVRHLEILFGLPGLFDIVTDIRLNELIPQEQIDSILAKPRTPRKMIELKEPIKPSVTEEMWAEACKRK